MTVKNTFLKQENRHPPIHTYLPFRFNGAPCAITYPHKPTKATDETIALVLHSQGIAPGLL